MPALLHRPLALHGGVGGQGVLGGLSVAPVALQVLARARAAAWTQALVAPLRTAQLWNSRSMRRMSSTCLSLNSSNPGPTAPRVLAAVVPGSGTGQLLLKKDVLEEGELSGIRWAAKSLST